MKLLPILLALAVLLSLAGCGRSDAGADSMTVLYLDAGKADCTILTDGAHTVLIDCAETDDGETIRSALRENHISQIDLLLVTHFDKDHIGGVPEVLRSFSVLRVIEPDCEPENPEGGGVHRISRSAGARRYHAAGRFRRSGRNARRNAAFDPRHGRRSLRKKYR